MSAKKVIKTKDIIIVNISKVKPNNFNVRKSTDKDLTELAESISQQGVLQPIMVRPKGDNFEIIYGERRYKATTLAKIKTIPVVVCDVDDATAMEYALTENIQRVDVSPIEEMNAYRQLITTNNYDITTLVAKFGKSESYIRSRIRLENLIPQFTELLLSEDITLAIAFEFCKYDVETQLDIFEKHYAEDICRYQNWQGKPVKDIKDLIESNYTTNLNNFFFDKTACSDCQYNTSTLSLFADADNCDRCLNKKCLDRKNVEYIVNRAIEIQEKNPDLLLARGDYRYCKDAVEILTEKKYDVKVIEYDKNCPIPPIAPADEDFDTVEDCQDAVKKYDDDNIEYQADTTKLTDLYNDGKVIMYAKIGTNGVGLSYIYAKYDSEENTPLVKLADKDKRNGEILDEKTIADIKVLINDFNPTKGDFTTLEEKLTYFAMLVYLKEVNYKLMGVRIDGLYFLSDKDKMRIINKLTEESKVIIRRDFISNTLKSAYRDTATAELLKEFAKQHAPDKLIEIETKYSEEYEKRHKSIQEKIKILE